MRARPISALLAALTLTIGACGHTPDTAVTPPPSTVTYAPLRQPFKGARLYVDRDSAGARWQGRHGAGWLDPITRTPQAIWLNGPRDLTRLPEVARDAQRQRALLVLVAYHIPNRGCSGFREGAGTTAEYERWIDRIIQLLGRTSAVVVMEPDALASDCFDPSRAELLNRSVRRLAEAGHHIYIDAGHSRWRSTGETAERLLAAGIAHAEGFSVNVANRQTTEDSVRWGRELSDLVGSREFVVDTSRNGLGPPPDDPSRDDEWCNPAQQALGEKPTPAPDLPRTAALLWIKRPGESDGVCGGETSYLFTARQARTLIAKSPSLPTSARRSAARVRLSAPSQQ